MGFSFGNYNGVCDTIAMVSCPLLGGSTGLVPQCYSRNIDINNTIIFQPGTFGTTANNCSYLYYPYGCDHYDIYYALARQLEIHGSRSQGNPFFPDLVRYFGVPGHVPGLGCDSHVHGRIPGMYEHRDPANLQWFTAIYIGLKTAIFWCLMLNGFVGFQFAEDGSALSLWSMRISALILWIISFVVAAETYNGNIKDQAGLWFFEFAFPVIMVLFYVVSQVILVLRTLDELWPLNDIICGCLAFAAGCILMYGFSNQICESVKHYIDGTFFGTLCSLLSVMMVYKYWDSITREDLEFSVGSRHANWDTKDNMLSDYDGSVQSHDNLSRGMSRTFDQSRTPSPNDHKEAAAADYPLSTGMTRNSSGGSSFFVPR